MRQIFSDIAMIFEELGKEIEPLLRKSDIGTIAFLMASLLFFAIVLWFIYPPSLSVCFLGIMFVFISMLISESN